MRPETQALINRVQRENHSYLTEDDVKALASDPETRLSLLLVRCGGGRFLAPADQVQHFIDMIEAYQIAHDFTKGAADALQDNGINPTLINRVCDTWADYVRDISLPTNFTPAGDPPSYPGGTLPGTSIPKFNKLNRKHIERTNREFNETDCSGVFDGHNVTSDADGDL